MNEQIQREKQLAIEELERVKKELLSCSNYESLVSEIDNSLQLIYNISNNTLSSNNDVLLRLQPSINHLRDMRHHILESKPKSTVDFGHEINLGIGMVQFELWDYSKQELYDLLDSIN